MLEVTNSESNRIIDELDVGVVIQNADAVITYANAKAVSLLGLTLDEILGRSTRDQRWNVIDPDGNQVLETGHPAIRAITTGQSVRDVILGVYRPDLDDRMWIMASAIPKIDASGAVQEVVVTFTDISTTQRAAQASESRYQSVIRAMSEGVVIHNPDGSIRFANASAARVLGLSMDQLLGRTPLDPRWRLVTPEGKPADEGDIPSEITQATGLAVERKLLSVHRPNGEQAWLVISTDPVREPGTETHTAVVATFTDITTERETGLALEASRLQVQRVLDAVPGVVFQYLHPHSGPDRLPFLGGRVREFLGVDADAIGDDPGRLFALVPADDLPRLIAEIELSVSNAAPFEFVSYVHPTSDSPRWLKAQSIPAQVPEGLLYTGVILDVTAEQRMLVALQRTQRREAMASLAAGIAHNFNNMLAVLLPNLQLALPNVSDDVRTLLVDAEQAARRASELVGQMLTVGRTSADESTRDVVDLVPLVGEALHICRSTFDRGIAIVDEIGVAEAFVRGHASHMQQVMLNLCLNARDAMEGRSDRRLTVTLGTDGPDDVVLTVRDTGAGMNPDTLRQLGEPFFTTKAAGAGTGLGLASAFHTVAEAGGHWTVDSTVGVGTTFTFRFPRAEAPSARAQSGSSASIPDESGHVLIIDDEEMVRRALARMLARAGFTSEEADRGDAALARLAQPSSLRADGSTLREFDAVLLDLSMPGLPGPVVLEQIVRDYPALPIIVMSGHVADPSSLADAMAILQKPVSQQELVATLGRAVRGHAVRGQAMRGRAPLQTSERR